MYTTDSLPHQKSTNQKASQPWDETITGKSSLHPTNEGTLRQTYHEVNNGSTKPNHFDSMTQATDKGLQLSFGTPPIQRPIMEKIKGRIHFVGGQIGGQNQV